MNLNIVISFIIGGLLLLALLTLNARVLHSSGEMVLNMSAKQKIETINDIMRRDFVRLGFNVAGSSCADSDNSPAIISATASRFVFCADIDNSVSTNAQQITWQFLTTEYTTTENPDDYTLQRSGPVSISSTGVSSFPVTDFSFVYLDAARNPTLNEDDIQAIIVNIETQSPAKFGNSDYSKSFLIKTFTPPNLHLGPSGTN